MKDSYQKGNEDVKRILDACCGSRMFWFNKNNPDVVFMDKRKINISTKDVLKVLPMQPLFGNRRGKSIFLVFMKS